MGGGLRSLAEEVRWKLRTVEKNPDRELGGCERREEKLGGEVDMRERGKEDGGVNKAGRGGNGEGCYYLEYVEGVAEGGE